MPVDPSSRRSFLQDGITLALGASVLGSTAGCIESRSPYAPPVVADRPDAVYVPAHFEGMVPIGTAADGPLSAGLWFSYPHRFWLLSGPDSSRVEIRPEDSLHLMAAVWDRETGTPISGVEPIVTLESSGSIEAERVLWPMLSQQMGFHYGDNLALPSGSYAVTLAVPPTADRRFGRFEEQLGTWHRFEFGFEWEEDRLEDVQITMVEDDRKGRAGALSSMTEESERRPHVTEALPGRLLGSRSSGEIQVTASVLGPRTGEPTLFLTASTPYNDYPIPMLGPTASIGSRTEPFVASLDPSIGMHYRTSLSGPVAGSPIRIDLATPPQVARHEGYETAFMDPEPVQFSVS